MFQVLIYNTKYWLFSNPLFLLNRRDAQHLIIQGLFFHVRIKQSIASLRIIVQNFCWEKILSVEDLTGYVE